VSRRFGEQPRPRVLVVNADRSNPQHAAIGGLAPTTRYVSGEDLQYIRQRDWDAAVVFGSLMGLEDHLYVIQFGGKVGGAINYVGATGVELVLIIRPGSRTVLFEAPDSVPVSVKPLISSLITFVSKRAEQGIPNGVMWAGHVSYGNSGRPIIDFPFIIDDDNYVLAGCFVRMPSASRWWWLPEALGQEDRWVAAALADWATINLEAFPGRPDWQERDEWSAPEELTLRTRLADLADRLAAVESQISTERSVVESELQEARHRVDQDDRILVTGQGSELVAAVASAFIELGFEVIDVDDEVTKPGDRLEDLRVRDGEDGAWTALAEVRGYGRGAQLNDLIRIGRFESRYVQETGSLPSALWHVVNHFVGSDPSTRPQPLAASPMEVQTFAESNGAVIDTRTLFQLVMKVRRGELSAEESRASLKAARGIFDGASGAA
jgi:hypothetical protein